MDNLKIIEMRKIIVDIDKFMGKELNVCNDLQTEEDFIAAFKQKYTQLHNIQFSWYQNNWRLRCRYYVKDLEKLIIDRQFKNIINRLDIIEKKLDITLQQQSNEKLSLKNPNNTLFLNKQKKRTWNQKISKTNI